MLEEIKILEILNEWKKKIILSLFHYGNGYC